MHTIARASWHLVQVRVRVPVPVLLVLALVLVLVLVLALVLVRALRTNTTIRSIVSKISIASIIWLLHKGKSRAKLRAKIDP